MEVAMTSHYRVDVVQGHAIDAPTAQVFPAALGRTALPPSVRLGLLKWVGEGARCFRAFLLPAALAAGVTLCGPDDATASEPNRLSRDSGFAPIVTDSEAHKRLEAWYKGAGRAPKSWKLAYTATSAADLITTEIALSRCERCYEGDPLLRGKKRWPIRGGLTVGMWILSKRAERRHPKWAKVVWISGTILNVALVANNSYAATK
jgi:hypothetical protein